MSDHYYINRATGKKEVEAIPCKTCLELLYHGNPLSWIFRQALCKWPLFSRLFGALQDLPASKKKVLPFIEKYQIDPSEFLEHPSSYPTFNAFFTRKLKPAVRPLARSEAILPADGRVLAFERMDELDGIWVKGKNFSLETLLQDASLAQKYAKGSLVIIRLAPVDYHRFHFPLDCTPSKATLLNGPLYSVHPIALRHNIDILSENKRVLTSLSTERFGTVLFVEVGATNVGSITQTHTPETPQTKGAEKGYFSFGGSCILLLFEPGKIELASDLLENTGKGLETLCRLGTSLQKDAE